MAKPSKPEQQALKVLKDTGLYQIPIPVEDVARHIGLRVEAVKFGDDVSGALMIKDSNGVIGYNASHPRVRQRFTVAHEIGHWELHRNDSNLFVDKQYRVAIALRDDLSSRGESRQEIEANAFAAALLIPSELLLQEIRKHHFDLATDERTLSDLAKLFKVSVQAMTIRLVNLGLYFAG